MALAPSGVLDGYLLSSYGFGAEMSTFRFIALSLVFTQEFLRAYSPLLYRGAAFLFRLLPQPALFGLEAAGAGGGMQERGGNGGRGGAKAKKEVVEAIVPEQYKTFVDDRKSSKGDENDMYMLKTHGFNKYRHLSKSFMKRNNLIGAKEGRAKMENEEEEEEEEEEEQE